MAAGDALTSAAGAFACVPVLPDDSKSENKICAIKDFFPSFPCCYVLERPADLRNSKQVSHRSMRTCTEIRQTIQILWEMRHPVRVRER
jgi:hypothetical protein